MNIAAATDFAGSTGDPELSLRALAEAGFTSLHAAGVPSGASPVSIQRIGRPSIRAERTPRPEPNPPAPSAA